MTQADNILNSPIEPIPQKAPQKPHLGRIKDWEIKDWYGHQIVVGEFVDHPDFAGNRGHTSNIVHRNGNEIETRNSHYTLVSDEDV